MSEPQEDQKINLTVKMEPSTEVQFAIKKTAPLKKLIKAFCDQMGRDPQTLRFFFDGQRLQEDSTIADCELEDGDSIDARIQQTGGS